MGARESTGPPGIIRRVAGHPVRMEIEDDLDRSRLTVFFRLLLAIPHYIWIFLWSIAAAVVAIINWFATLITGQSPQGLQLPVGVRQVRDPLLLVPAARREPLSRLHGRAPLVSDPRRDRRTGAATEMDHRLPALPLRCHLRARGHARRLLRGEGEEVAGAPSGDACPADDIGFFFGTGGVAFMVAFLAWFAILARGRMPNGFRTSSRMGFVTTPR